MYYHPSFRRFAAILRAAHTLEFTHFKEWATVSVKEEWFSYLPNVYPAQKKYAAEVIRLGRQCNIKTILKCAYYELVRSEGFYQLIDEDDAEEEENTITKEDYLLLINAREKLTSFWIRKAIPPPRSATCGSAEPGSCANMSSVINTLYRILVHDSEIYEKYRYDPLCGLDALIEVPWSRGEDNKHTGRYYICSECCKKWKEVWSEERKSLWDDLDTWFKLKE